MRGGAAPLVVALHGCTQTASDFAAGTRFDSVAERAGAFVVYPEQSTRANPRRCWNWFLERNQRRDGDEPSQILDLVAEIVSRYPIDEGRIFVAGLSAGGAMAAILAEVAPDVFAAAGIMAGVALHASNDVPSGLAAMRGESAPAAPAGDGARATMGGDDASTAGAYGRLRVTLWSGDADRVVDSRNTAVLARQFRELVGVAAAGESEERPTAVVERWRDQGGRVRVETWRLPGIGHAWSGGSFRGSHTDPRGPRASDEMMAFFLDDAARGAELAALRPTAGRPMAARRPWPEPE